MKKLLTILAAATATMFAFGDAYWYTGTSFEERDSTNLTWSALVDYTDAGGLVGDLYWYASPSDATEEVGVITNYNGDAYSGARPKKFVDESAAQDKFLRIETSDGTPLFRTIRPYNGEGGTQQVDVAEGVYLDTLVMFTPADGVENLDLANGDKIAISYVEHSEPDEKDERIWTNFVIRAGYVTGPQTVVATNYFAEVPAGVDMSKDTWHRLTVRAIKLGDGTVGFVIYLDGDMDKMLTYDTDVAAGYEAYTTQLANNSLVNQYLYNSTVHALFPSAVRSGDEKSSLSSVAFKGNGAIDDLSFTDDKPTFIAETTSVTVTWTPGEVTSVKLNSDTAVDAATLAAGSATVEPTNKVVSISVEFADGYVMGACAVTGGSGDWNGSDAFINLSAGATCEIVAMQPLYEVNDGITTSYYDDLDDAIEAAQAGSSVAPATLKLLADCNEALNFTEGYIILDLAGCDIQGNGSDFSIGNSGATLVITNSGAEASILIPADNGAGTEGTGPLFAAGGFTTIQAGTFEGIILTLADDDTTFAEDFVGITGGKFLYPGYDDEDPTSFYLYSCVAQGLDLTQDGDYVQVGTAAPQPTTFALTTTGGANATVTTSPANVSALTEETEVTITSTADQDYTYDGVDLTGTDWTYDSQTDAISMTTNISENTTVVVPDAVSEQSSEDWPEGQDLDDVAGKAAGDQFPGITNALATADAKAVATWAEAKGVAYADKGGILPEAFLLDCANTQAAIDEAAANFKVTAITVVGDTVTITPADGADYGNGKVVIEGTATLSPISWHEKTDGDHFFRATLVVKPVATP